MKANERANVRLMLNPMARRMHNDLPKSDIVTLALMHESLSMRCGIVAKSGMMAIEWEIRSRLMATDTSDLGSVYALKVLEKTIRPSYKRAVRHGNAI